MFRKLLRDKRRTDGTADSRQYESQSDISAQETTQPKYQLVPQGQTRCGFHGSGRTSRRMIEFASPPPALSAALEPASYRNDNRRGAPWHKFRRFVVLRPGAPFGNGRIDTAWGCSAIARMLTRLNAADVALPQYAPRLADNFNPIIVAVGPADTAGKRRAVPVIAPHYAWSAASQSGATPAWLDVGATSVVRLS